MLTPEEDGPVEELLIYLQDYLNLQAESYYSQIAQPVAKAVNGIVAVQTDLNSVLKLPLLACYRTSFYGDMMEFSNARLEYFPFKGIQTMGQRSGLFTWVARHLAIALDNYNEMENCLRIVERTETATLRYPSLLGAGGPMIIPYLRWDIALEDYERPA